MAIIKGIEQISLDTDGPELIPNVGIGIASSSADGTLHVHTATAGSVTANAGANDLVVENNGDGGISILGPDNAFQSLFFGSPMDTIGSILRWNHDQGTLELGSAKAGGELAFFSDDFVEAARFDSAGTMNVVGAITVGSTVDGRDLATDGTKLDGIATGAEVNDGQDLGEFTIAGLPTASSNANAYALATDASGGRTIVRSDGTNWKIVVVEGATVS